MEKNRSTITRISASLIVAGLVVGLSWTLISPTAQAGPITGGGGNSPYVKLGVYQGVIAIVPPGGASIMEIGNLGRDIAGSTDIYLRPGAVPALSCTTGLKIGSSCVAVGSPTADCTKLGVPGTCSQAAPRIVKSGTDANFDVSLGRLCLKGTGSYDCRNVWPPDASGGDTYWETASVGGVTYLRPNASGLPDTIRIGLQTAPVPGTSGYGFDVEANVDAPAVLVTAPSGQLALFTGYWTGTTYAGGSVVTNGKVNGQLINFWINGYLGFTPYNASQKYYKSPSKTIFEATGIDADMFDGTTNLAFGTTGDVFWKNKVSTNHICLHTTVSAMCLGGTNPTTNAGTPCPIGNECVGGATCTNMCGTLPATCPADGLPKHCSVTTSRTCTVASDCPVTEYCLQGRLRQQSGYTDSGCTLTTGGPGLTCPQICAFNVACDSTGPGLCGTRVNSDFGVAVLRSPSTPACVFSGTSYQLSCDCTLSKNTTYLKTQPAGSGGDLCTQNFSPT